MWHFRKSVSDREKKQCFLTARDCGQFRKIRVLLNRAAASRFARFRKTRIVTLAPAGRGSAKLPRRSLLSACGARLVAGRVAAFRSQGGGACPRPCVSPPRQVLFVSAVRACLALCYAPALPRPTGVASLRGAPDGADLKSRRRAAAVSSLSKRLHFRLLVLSPLGLGCPHFQRPPILAHRLRRVKGTPKFFRSSASGRPKNFWSLPLDTSCRCALLAVLRKWDTRSPGEIEQRAKGKI